MKYINYFQNAEQFHWNAAGPLTPKMRTKSVKLLMLFLGFTYFGGTHSFCQKLPKIQEKSLRIPKNLIVDGKATEWNNKFEADNKATGIAYTIANDDEKIYLVFRGSSSDIIRKVITGGVTISLSTSKESDDKSITFPIYDKSNPPLTITIPSDQSNVEKDSLMKSYNKKLLGKLKLIGVNGIRSITDSILSVYNEEEINVKCLFDSNLNFTYELSLPIKHITANAIPLTKLNYKVRFNGIWGKDSNVRIIRGITKTVLEAHLSGSWREVGEANPQNMFLAFSSHFGGKYVLAKKEVP